MSRFERWSRRKLGQQTNEPVEAPPQEALRQAQETEGAAADASPTEAVESEPAPGSLDATLPDPDSLPADADFSAYLVKGVSSQLRRRALRRLWSTGGYGVRDGLDDYDENYREVLKPLARDLADQLRRWTRPEPEGDDVLARDGQEPAAAERDQAQAQSAERADTETREPEARDVASVSVTDEEQAQASRPLDQGSIGQEDEAAKD
ncbi:DUF3306 domain-containing protein [Halomonas sp. PBN3]|uniref:DUF3306 domain-containing protein n=1 Tax=Halomonas sp. PBN3 TaxID=1397528 RepID=UPI0003B8279C|nr:DUF3306 domain-containing protein [Halomonas sp. PBN3]ERS90009.1 hypothetical protein Q671_05565 [Halomonas sp. PBN3]